MDGMGSSSSFSGGPSGGGTFIAHTPKALLSTLPPPLLIGSVAETQLAAGRLAELRLLPELVVEAGDSGFVAGLLGIHLLHTFTVGLRTVPYRFMAV